VAQLTIAARWCIVLCNKGVLHWERAGTRRDLWGEVEGLAQNTSPRKFSILAFVLAAYPDIGFLARYPLSAARSVQ
jgi:hypothetical protein